MKVAVTNNTAYTIHDATLHLKLQDKVLRLDHIEPDYPLDGKMVIIGNIAQNEKKTVAFYLDPMICTETQVDCNLFYRDYKGKPNSKIMESKKLKVVCPILHTESQINIGILKKLIDQINIYNCKVFNLPETM